MFPNPIPLNIRFARAPFPFSKHGVDLGDNDIPVAEIRIAIDNLGKRFCRIQIEAAVFSDRLHGDEGSLGLRIKFTDLFFGDACYGNKAKPK